MVHKVSLVSLSGADDNNMIMSDSRCYDKPQWDINDGKLPVPNEADLFQLWPDGHSRYIYSSLNHEEARRHISGWAMRNTNNHNVNILKKSCLGVLLCSSGCRTMEDRPTTVRPAICDKARKKQCGKPCPNSKCNGVLVLTPCRGHCGYPVTHFWRQHGPYLYFQSKGTHDHPQPELKIPASHKKIIRDKESGKSLRKRGRIQDRKPSSCTDPRLPKISGPMCSCPPFECLCGKQFAPSVPPFPNLAEEFSKPSQYDSSMFLHSPFFPYHHSQDPYSPYAPFSDIPPLYLPRPGMDFFSTPPQNHHVTNLSSSGSLFDQLAATSRPSPNQSLHTMSNATSFSSPPPLHLNIKNESGEGQTMNHDHSNYLQTFRREDSAKSTSPLLTAPESDNICAYLVNTLSSTFKSEGFNPISPPPFLGTTAASTFKTGLQTPEFKPSLSSSPNPHSASSTNYQIEELKLKSEVNSSHHEHSPPAKSAFLPYSFDFMTAAPSSNLPPSYPQFVDYSNFYSRQPKCNFPKPSFESGNSFSMFHGGL